MLDQETAAKAGSGRTQARRHHAAWSHLMLQEYSAEGHAPVEGLHLGHEVRVLEDGAHGIDHGLCAIAKQAAIRNVPSQSDRFCLGMTCEGPGAAQEPRPHKHSAVKAHAADKPTCRMRNCRLALFSCMLSAMP